MKLKLNNELPEFNIAVRAVKLMQETFKNEYAIDVFFNKHFCNPNRVVNPVDIISENGFDAGVGCFLGMKILNNEGGYSKKELIVTQNCELCVHPDFQGKGFFHKIIDERENKDKESQFIFALPNEKSFPAFMKNGYSNCADITRYRKYTNRYVSLIKKVIRKLIGKKPKINSVIDACNVKELSNYFSNVEYDEINSVGIRFERSEELFRWLFSQKKSEYLLKEYDENKNLIAYVIFRHEYCPLGTVIAVDDWYSKNGNSEYFKRIINKLSRRCDMIEIYTVNEKIDGEFMRKAGLTNIKLYEKNFKDRPLVSSPNGKKYSWFERVSIRNIDDDYFFYE